ncbi:MAG: PhnD/SsuA/transferrin family substrate-binding protein, partial [Gammaproteobacteria bacterium]
PLARAGRFFARAVETGAHVESLGAVARAEADVAAIDAVVWGLLERHRPHALAGVRVLKRTVPAPALPYVAPACIDAGKLGLVREALQAAAGDESLASARAALLIAGFDILDDSDYERIDDIERVGIDAGYTQLR